MISLGETLKLISERHRKLGKASLMTHVVLGYPTLKDSLDIARAQAEAGASIIELQIPFSDPIADGPTIMQANQLALDAGVRPRDCLVAAEKLARELPVSVLLMSYFNILLNYRGRREQQGLLGFCREAQQAGVAGLIIPDVPPEEQRERFQFHCRDHNLTAIPLVSPLTSTRRLELIRNSTQSKLPGFVYCVSTTGTTGARSALPADLPQYLKRVRRVFSTPLAVGFGISSRAQVASLAKHAEIAVVGSAMIDLIAQTKLTKRMREVRGFTQELLR